MLYHFNGSDSRTIGVEIELQLVDAETGELTNSIQRILDRVPARWSESVKPEFMQCFCEINTGICRTVREVEEDLTEKLAWANGIARELGMRFIWAGTHPVSRWDSQLVSPGERYAWLMETMQHVVRRLATFGLHIHVGVDTGDKAVHLCDRFLRHLPVLLALSSNSPCWCGRDTGMASYRSRVMDSLPTAGMPQVMRNWSEYAWLVNHLVETHFIRSIREIWWDVRPHAGFGTVELRIMDMPMNMHHLLGIVALTQSLVAAVSDHIDQGAYQFDCHPMIAKQNKWHAARYGMDAKLVDFDTMRAMPVRQIVEMLMDRCAPYAESLGCTEQLGYLNDILDNGAGSCHQLAVLEKTGDMREVVNYLIDQSP